MSLLILPRRFRDFSPISVDTGYKAKFKVGILHANGEIEEPFGPEFRPNLILNSGLDMLMTSVAATGPVSTYTASGSWYPMLCFCRAGTGTTPVTAADTALATPQSVSSTLASTGNGLVNDTTNGGVTITFVYQFTAESGTVVYNECGLSDTSSGPLFSRVLFPSGLTVLNTQSLLIAYSLTISVPCIVTPITVSAAPQNGFDISGQLKLQGGFAASLFGTVSTSGAFGGGNPSINGVWLAMMRGRITGSTAGMAWLATNSAFPAVDTNLTPAFCSAVSIADNGNTGATVNPAYVPGTFSRTFTFPFPINNPSVNVSTLRSILFFNSFAWSPGPTSAFGSLQLLLNSPQTKSTTNTLSLNLTVSVSKV